MVEYNKKKVLVLSVPTATHSKTNMAFPIMLAANMGICIHKIVYRGDFEKIKADGKSLKMQLTPSENATQLLDPNSENVIDHCEIAAQLNTNGGQTLVREVVHDFGIKNILFSGQSLHFSAYQDTGSSMTLYCEIHYSVRKLGGRQVDEQLFNAIGYM